MVTLDMPGLRLKGLNVLLHMNPFERDSYNKRVRKSVEMSAFLLGFMSKDPSPKKKKVTITVSHKGVFDKDGLYASVKPVLDAIVARPAVAKIGRAKIKLPLVGGKPILRWGLILDDSPAYIDLEVLQLQTKGYAVKVEVMDS